MCLGFLGVDFALLGILLIGLPALLSFQLMVLRDRKNEGLSNDQAFRGFRAYYSFYFGVYRFWLSFARSLLVFALAFLAISLSSYYIYSSCSQEFAEQAYEFALLLSQQGTAVEKVLEAYQNYGALQEFSAVSLLSSFGLAGYWFVHEIGRNCSNLYARYFLAGAPARFANAQFGDFFRRSRKTFYSFYYPCLWPGILLYALGYGLGSSLGYLFTKNATFALTFGFLGALLLLSPFLPYFFYAIDEYSKGANASFVSYILAEAESTLKTAEEKNELNAEETRQLHNDIDELKKRLGPHPGEEKKNDDDQNSSSGS